MNLAILIVIGIPLTIYLAVLLLSTFRESDNATGAADSSPDHIDAQVPSVIVSSHDEPARVPLAFAVAAVETSQPDSEQPTSSEESVLAVRESTLPEPPASETALAETLPPTSDSDAAPIRAETQVESLAGAVVAEQIVAYAATDNPSVPVVSVAAQAAPASIVSEIQESDSESLPPPHASPDAPDPILASSAVDQAADRTTEITPGTVTPTAQDSTPTAAPVPPADSASLQSEDEPAKPEGPVVLPDKETPKYAFDYRGRLWIEKKNKGFFRQLRRPQLPPDDPQSTSSR